jgi:hypothetical protein
LDRNKARSFLVALKVAIIANSSMAKLNGRVLITGCDAIQIGLVYFVGTETKYFSIERIGYWAF